MDDIVYTPDGTRSPWRRRRGDALINADTGALLNPNFEHVSALDCITMSPDGKTVVTGSHDGGIRFWDARTGRLLATDNDSTQQVSDVKFDPAATFWPSAGSTLRVHL